MMSDEIDREPSPEWRGRVWVDLLTEEIAARSAQHRVTGRALLYIEAGLPVQQVYDALKLTHVEWIDRVAAHDAWRAENRAAAERITWTRTEVERAVEP